jgi:AmmeMemoRadiSam system protein B
MVASVRSPAVSGLFYPSEAGSLLVTIEQCFAAAAKVFPDDEAKDSRALIVPHAGYTYSGRVAAAAYRRLPRRFPAKIAAKIAVLGPSHRVPLRGIAAPTDDYFATPLGRIPVDQGVIGALSEAGIVHRTDAPHALEHSIEVHLPFLQYCLQDFSLVPLVVGEVGPGVVEQVIEALYQQGFFIIVSSDLSHFLPYDAAVQTDTETAQRIRNKDWHLDGEQACGCRAVNGLLKYAQDNDLEIVPIAQENSGDLTGDKSRVVGYGAWSVRAPHGEHMTSS